ncbi:MAG: SIMPL domain-containing protein [Candidatus Doudnabacteria bacterium]
METNIKPWLWQTLAILLGIFLVLVVLEKGYTVSQDFRPSQPKNTISMSAEGKASATPDLATINVGVVSSSTTAKLVQDDMTLKANKITDFVKQQGIASKDITTSNFSVYPSYDYQNGKNTINGYQGSQSISVKVHGVDKSTDNLSKILAGAVLSGGNQIQGVQFSFDDPDNLKQVARKQAIDKAKQKAQELADATGLKLGRIVSISENNAGYPTPMPYATGMGGGGSDVKSVAPTIEPGSQDVTATVSITFEIK